MPLVEMQNDVGCLECMKVETGYGLPKQFPLALNGIGGGGIGYLGCGGDCNCKCNKGMGAADVTNPAAIYLANRGSGPAPTANAVEKTYAAIDLPIKKSTGNMAASGNSFSDALNSISNAIVSTVQGVAPAFKGSGGKKPRVVMQPPPPEAPDYTTPAIIVGGVAVVGMLFYALAKKGK